MFQQKRKQQKLSDLSNIYSSMLRTVVVRRRITELDRRIDSCVKRVSVCAIAKMLSRRPVFLAKPSFDLHTPVLVYGGSLPKGQWVSYSNYVASLCLGGGVPLSFRKLVDGQNIISTSAVYFVFFIFFFLSFSFVALFLPHPCRRRRTKLACYRGSGTPTSCASWALSE